MWKKVGIYSIGIIFSILCIVGLSFGIMWFLGVGIFSSQNNQYDKNNVDNNPNPKNIKFISERSFSLRFDSNGELGYGTGWLFAKDPSVQNNNFTYYVATNLHVAAFLQNINKTYTNEEGNIVNGANFHRLSFGQILTRNADGSFETGTTNSFLSPYEINYWQYVPISDVSIAYTSFDLFSKIHVTETDRNGIFYDSNTSDQTPKNYTSDIALLKINFANRKPINNSLQIDPIKLALDAFDRNPTKFYTGNMVNNKTKKITIAGFPAVDRNQFPNSANVKWISKSNLTINSFTTGLSNKINPLNLLPTGWINKTQAEKIAYAKTHVLPSYIPFVDDAYASRKNVALQALFRNTETLSGGSSGSMVVDENNMVIGIYWGSYRIASNQSPEGIDYGAIDLFINSQPVVNALSQVLLSPYNTINDIKTKLNLTLI